MTDILAIGDARAAIRAIDGDTADDDDLNQVYIPAVTPIVEDIIGPVITTAGLTFTDDGVDRRGQPLFAVRLPSPVVSVESVTERTGDALVEGNDYVVNKRVGIVYRGPSLSPRPFYPGTQNVVISYTAGPYANQAAVPGFIKLGARIILAQLWQVDNAGSRPAFGQPDTETVETPSGFIVPKHAYEVLSPAIASGLVW